VDPKFWEMGIWKTSVGEPEGYSLLRARLMCRPQGWAPPANFAKAALFFPFQEGLKLKNQRSIDGEKDLLQIFSIIQGGRGKNIMALGLNFKDGTFKRGRYHGNYHCVGSLRVVGE